MFILNINFVSDETKIILNGCNIPVVSMHFQSVENSVDPDQMASLEAS